MLEMEMTLNQELKLYVFCTPSKLKQVLFYQFKKDSLKIVVTSYINL